MKLMFNKKNYTGQWFQDDENPKDFTEKVPANTGYTFDDELDDWIAPEIPEQNNLIIRISENEDNIEIATVTNNES